MSRPTGSKALPEVNALDVKNPVRENKIFWGRGRRDYRGREINYNPHNKYMYQWNRSDQVPKGKEIQANVPMKCESACFRCDTKGHWSQVRRTPAQHCALYKSLLKKM